MPETPEEPASEREDRRDEPYAAVMHRLGLHTPLGASWSDPAGIGSGPGGRRRPAGAGDCGCARSAGGALEDDTNVEDQLQGGHEAPEALL